MKQPMHHSRRYSGRALPRLLSCALALTGLSSFYAVPALAEDYISPDLIKISTPTYRTSWRDFEPRLGTYTYSVSWEGIPAASATVTVDEDGESLKVEANARTNSTIDLFYRLRYQAIGLLGMLDLSSRRLQINHTENSREKRIEMDFFEDGEINSVNKRVDKGEQTTLRFASNNTTLDPIAAGFLARGLDWEAGETKSFDVFNGKSRYLISLTATGRTTIDYQGQKRDVWEISPRVRNLTQTRPIAKLREAKIYVSADSHREILRVVSSVFIGSVFTELESFEPSGKRIDTVRMAQLRRESHSDTLR